MTRLTTKQQAFIAEYPKDFNATQAAIRAGYSKRTARFIGCENLTKPNIADEISKHIEKLCMSRDEALFRLSAQARFNVGEYLTFNELGNPVIDLVAVVGNGFGHLIKKITHTKYGDTIEFYDAETALLHIVKHHRLFVDRQEIDLTSGGKPLFTIDDFRQVQTELQKWQDEQDDS